MKRVGNTILIFVLLLAVLPFTPGVVPVRAASADLFFSEYIEGSSNNKALEIFNNTGAAINLADAGYNVQMFFNGSSSAGLTINLTGTVANGDAFVLAHSSANATIQAQADQTNGSGWFNGDDTVVLRNGTTVLDVIGQIGFDPGSEWGSGLTSTADNTLRRKTIIQDGDTNGSDAFDPALQWDGFATDTFDGLGSHTVASDAAPEVTGTTPVDEMVNVPVDQNLTVNFSEPVNLNGTDWFTLSCATSQQTSFEVSSDPAAQTYTINPSSDLIAGEQCTLTILASAVSDQDTDDPPDTMLENVVVDFTAYYDYCLAGPEYVTSIPAVQGTGSASPLVNTTINVRGVVVGDYEGPSPNLRGFYLQDPTGDGLPESSDALFVFNGNNDSVQLGDLVAVSGRVDEFQSQTQISSFINGVQSCGEGSVNPVDITLPLPSADYLERFEGMLVHLPQTLSVTEHFQLGRFGQVVLSSDGRLNQPTSLAAPGAEATALQAQNNLNRIILDDNLNNQNPDPIVYARQGEPLSASNTLRGGDTVSGITGVLTYTWAGNSASGNAFRVRPLNALGGSVPSFMADNPRPTMPDELGGKVKVVGMNLLNYFNTFTGCTEGVGGANTDCRGADSASEFDRQWAKTVSAILTINPDVLGVVEIENDGYDASSAIQHLVDQLNVAAGPGAYAFIDVDAGTGQTNALGSDAIKVGLIYQPARVAPVGNTSALNSVEFVNGGDSDPRNRPAVAQAFEYLDGGRFVVSVNHLKSKGSACDAPDAGDGQGNCNLVRTNAAQLLAEWLASDPTGTGDPDVLILGDLNAYAMEDPISILASYGYANLIEALIGPDAYSYVFDGQWGYLDHALASPSLAAQVSGVQEYHINADEPSVLDYNEDFKSPSQVASLYEADQYRVSDHDPIIVGLDLNAPPSAGPISAPSAPVPVGQEISASLPFSDPDPADTHTAIFDWGDGATSAGLVTEANGAGSASGSHIYSVPGIYTITATVSDSFGHSAQSSFQYVVVVDPNGHSVAGGGWIQTPAGAYGPDPSLTGRASFDFSAKYQKNHPTPLGTFQFVFKAAGVSFQSTGIDWLVVDGALVYLQGVGALNGQGEYGFLIAASDGSPDRIRIKIWELVSGSVIYDSQPGAEIPAAPTTELGGGKILIR